MTQASRQAHRQASRNAHRSISRRPGRTALVAALIAAALAPATAFADVDTITKADVDADSTYTWGHGSAAELSVAELAIRDAVDREMAARGYVEVEGDADLNASLSADKWKETRMHSRPPMTMNPRFDRWAFMRGVEVTDVREVDRGRFDVRLSDADSSEMVWHGTAEGSPRSKMEKNVEEITEAVEEMFEDFGEVDD
ncbi:MAG: DUF4136 domain-containing protein [Acidobacteriota bacterium]